MYHTVRNDVAVYTYFGESYIWRWRLVVVLQGNVMSLEHCAETKATKKSSQYYAMCVTYYYIAYNVRAFRDFFCSTNRTDQSIMSGGSQREMPLNV